MIVLSVHTQRFVTLLRNARLSLLDTCMMNLRDQHAQLHVHTQVS